MFDVIIDRNKRYKADEFFQWDTHVLFNIYGLSLGRAPEIHFAKSGMSEAIVKQSEMTRDGIISVEMPDIMLRTTAPIVVYICGYEGEEFRTWYKLELKVNARPKPADYIAEDDEKIYSYNALEYLVQNTVTELTRANEDLHTQITAEGETLHAQINSDTDAKNAQLLSTVNENLKDTTDNVNANLNHTVGLVMGTKSQTTTFNEDGSITTNYVDGTSEHTVFNDDGSINQRFDWGDMGVRNAHIVFNADGSITTTFTEEASE
jgi:hypothetical protein